MSDPASALAALGAIGSITSSMSGAGLQDQSLGIQQDLLNQAKEQRKLGALLGETGAVGNPFSSQYGPLFQQALGDMAGSPAAPTGANNPYNPAGNDPYRVPGQAGQPTNPHTTGNPYRFHPRVP